jgi:hypothetical protein
VGEVVEAAGCNIIVTGTPIVDTDSLGLSPCHACRVVRLNGCMDGSQCMPQVLGCPLADSP